LGNHLKIFLNIFCLPTSSLEDNGKNWRSIKGNLPDEPVHVIREDPEKENILYLGTELTIYVSLDRGKTWHSLKANLPTNPVMDLQIHPREKELIIGTHGRGVHIVSVEEIRNRCPSGKFIKSISLTINN
jgi:hypothetical protein